ncbi:MAG: hypothetical protein ABIK82_01395 [Pseudomonadota bacterium]
MKRRLAFVLLAASLALPAYGADKKADAAREQIRRLQLSQRKLEQEKALLAQEKTALDGQLTEAAGKLDETRRQAAAAARKATGLEKELAAAQAEKQALDAKLTDAGQRLAKLSEQQRITETERRRLDALAIQQKQSIASCEEHNARLHDQGVALLEKYRAKSCFDSAMQNEPFTGLKQVEIDNFIEDNHEQLDEHKLDRQAPR